MLVLGPKCFYLPLILQRLGTFPSHCCSKKSLAFLGQHGRGPGNGGVGEVGNGGENRSLSLQRPSIDNLFCC